METLLTHLGLTIAATLGMQILCLATRPKDPCCPCYEMGERKAHAFAFVMSQLVGARFVWLGSWTFSRYHYVALFAALASFFAADGMAKRREELLASRGSPSRIAIAATCFGFSYFFAFVEAISLFRLGFFGVESESLAKAMRRVSDDEDREGDARLVYYAWLITKDGKYSDALREHELDSGGSISIWRTSNGYKRRIVHLFGRHLKRDETASG